MVRDNGYEEYCYNRFLFDGIQKCEPIKTTTPKHIFPHSNDAPDLP